VSKHRPVLRRWPRQALVAGVALALIGVGAAIAVHAGAVTDRAAACRPGVDAVESAPDAAAPDGRREVWIHRPAGLDHATVPVLYLLHGYPGRPADLARSALPGLLDQQTCRSGRPFVIAMPDGRAGQTDTEWGDAADGRFAIERFVTTTAITLVEGAHRRPAALRAIGGFSMGGYGAAVLALRHPDRYRQVVAFSGYYRPDDPDRVFDDDAAHAPDRLLAASAGQRYFLVEGTDEDTPLTQGSIRGEADRFAGLLLAAGVIVTVLHPRGGHDANAWYPQLAAMARFLDAGWPT
jgi:predicted esterase